LKMVQKSKLAFIPEPTRPPRNVKPVAGAAQSIAYYPGCSLHSTASEFNTSTKSVCSALDMQLIEPKGWICCGSSAAHRADPEAGTRFPVENLAIIEKSGFSEVTMPCAACFNRHKAAQYKIHKHPERKAAVDDAIGYDYKDTVQVTTLIDAILDHAGAEKVASLVSGDLSKLNAVCYYGCLLTRPPEVTGAESPENPEEMDRLMQALGINVIDWSYKTSCCGASHSLTRPDIVFELSSNLIRHAQEAGADVIIVACPLCHTNLDARQFQMDLESPTPVLYFTQLMALAFGLPESSAALKKNLVDPYPVLRQRSVL